MSCQSQLVLSAGFQQPLHATGLGSAAAPEGACKAAETAPLAAGAVVREVTTVTAARAAAEMRADRRMDTPRERKRFGIGGYACCSALSVLRPGQGRRSGVAHDRRASRQHAGACLLSAGEQNCAFLRCCPEFPAESYALLHSTQPPVWNALSVARMVTLAGPVGMPEAMTSPVVLFSLAQ